MNFDPNGNNLFQILISDNPEQDLQTLPVIRSNRDSFEALHPELRYFLLTKFHIRSIVATYFESAVLATYDALVPYAYKADLARYCLLYQFGGVYADLSMRLLTHLNLPNNKSILCFRDAYVNGGSTWSVSNGLIRATPHRLEFRTAIDLIVENHKNFQYGASLLHPTGPALFGRALALVDRGEDLEVGDFRNLTGSEHPLSYGYVDPAGRLVCVRMKENGGDLALIGVKGNNMYDALWASRIIYGEPVVINHDDSRLYILQVEHSPNGFMLTPDMHGLIIFGPYIYLTAGRYYGRYRFEKDFVPGCLTLDVAFEGAIIGSSSSQFLKDEGAATISFELQQSCPKLELRLTVHGGCHGHCLGLTIDRLPDIETYSSSISS